MPVDDLNQIFGDKLREAGLAVDHVEMDGLLHRCGTSAKPGEKDGAYVVHTDHPASIWWQNWQTEEKGTYCPVNKNTMTAADRDTLKKRIAEDRARRVGDWLAVPPVRGIPGASDINDLYKKGGVDAVWRCLAAARIPDDEQPEKEHMTASDGSGGNSTPLSAATGNGLPASALPEGYFLIADGPRAGLYCVERRRGEEQEVRLGPPLFIRGMTRDADSNEWGLWLEWNDPDGKLHQWAMPLELLSRYNSDWHATLVRGGWLGDPRHKSKVAAPFVYGAPNRACSLRSLCRLAQRRLCTA